MRAIQHPAIIVEGGFWRASAHDPWVRDYQSGEDSFYMELLACLVPGHGA